MTSGLTFGRSKLLKAIGGRLSQPQNYLSFTHSVEHEDLWLFHDGRCEG